jgi:ankyrin repeat protein
MQAAYDGDVEKVRFLISAGANVNIQFLFHAGANERIRSGGTSLMAAVGRYDEKHIEIVKILLANGANVNATDFRGFSALRLAQRYGFFKMVDLLASHGGT